MWTNVTGQERVKKILKNIFQNGKLSHAYIFYGSEGVGKDAAAIEFAKLINCDNPVNGNEACDQCSSCIQIDNFKSPLFKFIIALPTGKNETDEESNPLEKLDKDDYAVYLEQIDLKINDKYHKIKLPRANDIRISSIRQIKKDIYLTGKSGKKKIFLISECDLMNQQSSNSILKILEEPPGDSLLILTTSRINSLLPTISGRCQKIKFDLISKTDIVNYIKEKKSGVDSFNADFFAELSEGSISKTNDILENNYLELREKVLDFLSSSMTGQYLKLGNDIDFIAAKKDKERIKKFLLLLALWFGDIINKSAGSESLIVNKDKIERIKNFESKFESRNFEIISLIEDAVNDIDSNIFPELLLFNLSYEIKSRIKAKS